MQGIKKLLRIIRSKEKKANSLCENYFIGNGKEQTLYQGIITGNFQNDHSAAKNLYASKPEDARYATLKSRLEEKLLTYIVFLDLQEGSTKQWSRIENRCELLLYQAKALFRQKEYQISERIVKKVLRLAKDYEFSQITLECLDLLVNLYSKTGEHLSFKKVKEDCQTVEQLVSGERKSALLYREAKLLLISGDISDRSLSYVSDLVAQLLAIWKEVKTFNSFDYYYRLHVEQLQLEGNYEQLFALTTFSEEFLKHLNINAKRFDYRYNHILSINACLRTNELEKGIQLAKEFICIYEVSSDHWLTYYENYYFLALHAQDYCLCEELLKRVAQYFITNKITGIQKEKWYLFTAYYQWETHNDKLIEVLEDQMVKQHLPSIRKDKTGYNIAILLLQFCHYLSDRRKEALYNKSETYRKYMERHLTSDSQQRERILFLLVQLIIRNDFQPEQITRKASKLVDQLQHCALPGGAKNSGVEIIPYDRLWNKMLAVIGLVNKTRKP